MTLKEKNIFEPLESICKTFESALMEVGLCSEDSLTRTSAAYSLVLAAKERIPSSAYFDDSIKYLNELARCKLEVDIASQHDTSVITMTHNILYKAQEYFQECLIPCTEWATPEELKKVVISAAEAEASNA